MELQRSCATGMDNKKKRLFLIVFIGAVAVAAALLLMESDVLAPPPSASNSVAGPNNKASQTAAGPVAPVLPKGAVVSGKPIRDIFLPPAGYAALAQKNGATGGQARGGVRAAAAGQVPVLTGVIEGAGTRVVILRQGAISRSHRVGESAGAYLVASIGTRSVTLEGPSGTIILTMGQ